MAWRRRVVVVPVVSSFIGLLMPYLLLALQRLFSASDGARRSLGGLICALAPMTFVAGLGRQEEFERDQLQAALMNAVLYALGGLAAIFVARRGKVLRWSAVALLALWIVIATWFGASWTM